MAVIYGPELWQGDDPSPEDLQRAFRDAQVAKRDGFLDALGRRYPAMNNGTLNEPERELSAADIHAMLTDLVAFACDAARHIYGTSVAGGEMEEAMLKHYAALEANRDRLDDAPPF